MSAEQDPYEATGVDYGVLDAAKVVAQQAALATSLNPQGRGAFINDASRGEPATVIRLGGMSLGFVLECLGTKSMFASTFEKESGIDRFSSIGYDTVAAAVNDCICVGALPIVVNAYFATGAASFYAGSRHRSLVAGFARACDDSRAAWGGGESPTLNGLVAPAEIDLAASAIGVIAPGIEPLLGEQMRDGDAIVFIASSGLHANGASLARNIGASLDRGLLTELPSGRRFGDAILDESVIYVSLMEALQRQGVGLHYASHITGHGLRKLMRANRDLTYRINRLPTPPEVLTFLAEKASMSMREAYGTLNMGVGFALYVDPADAERTVTLAQSLGHGAMIAGAVEQGPRRVILEPVNVTYEGSELELR